MAVIVLVLHVRPQPKRDRIVSVETSTLIGAEIVFAIAKNQMLTDGRGRDEDFSSPPAQIPACAANAPGSSLGSDVVR